MKKVGFAGGGVLVSGSAVLVAGVGRYYVVERYVLFVPFAGF
jgi:hypothetical protein